MDVNHNEDMSKELSIMQWRCISAMGHQWGPHHVGIQLGYHGDTYNGDSYDGDVYVYIYNEYKYTTNQKDDIGVCPHPFLAGLFESPKKRRSFTRYTYSKWGFIIARFPEGKGVEGYLKVLSSCKNQ